MICMITNLLNVFNSLATSKCYEKDPRLLTRRFSEPDTLHSRYCFREHRNTTKIKITCDNSQT